MEGSSNVLRLEFREGFTSNEIPMWIGLHVPVLLYAMFGGFRLEIRLWATMLMVLSATVVYLSASVAAMFAYILVLIIFMIAFKRTSLRMIGKISLVVGTIMLALILLNGDELVESAESKLLKFMEGECILALAYTDMLNRII